MERKPNRTALWIFFAVICTVFVALDLLDSHTHWYLMRLISSGMSADVFPLIGVGYALIAVGAILCSAFRKKVLAIILCALNVTVGIWMLTFAFARIDQGYAIVIAIGQALYLAASVLLLVRVCTQRAKRTFATLCMVLGILSVAATLALSLFTVKLGGLSAVGFKWWEYGRGLALFAGREYLMKMRGAASVLWPLSRGAMFFILMLGCRLVPQRQAVQPTLAPAAPVPSYEEDALERLNRLHEQGILTDEEHQAKRAELLAKL